MASNFDWKSRIYRLIALLILGYVLIGPLGDAGPEFISQLEIRSDSDLPLLITSSAKIARLVLEGREGSVLSASDGSQNKFLFLQANSELDSGAYVGLMGLQRDLIGMSSGSVLIGTADSSATGDILFRTTGIDRLMVDQDGHVGIGTTSPEALLEINATMEVPLRVLTTASVSWMELEGNIGGTITSSRTAVDKFLSLQATGSVDTGATIALLGSQIEGTGTGTGSVLIESARSSGQGDILFRTQGLNRLIIDQDGNIGIGTIFPQKTVHINGTVQLDGDLLCKTSCVERSSVKGLIAYIAMAPLDTDESSEYTRFDSVFLGQDLLPETVEITFYARGISESEGCWEVRVLQEIKSACGKVSQRIEIPISYEVLPEMADEIWLEFRSLSEDTLVKIQKAWVIVYNP